MFDIVIVGGGPAGCFSGELAGKNGFNTLILEEDKEIGHPVHCTGIVGEELFSSYDIDRSCIYRKIDSVKVHFPSGKRMTLPTKIEPLILDRAALDRQLADKAADSGCEIEFGAKAVKLEQSEDCISLEYEKEGSTKTVKAKFCIIASGAMSRLPYDHGISEPTSIYHSVQVDAHIHEIEGIELFLGSEFTQGSFAYAVSSNGQKSKIGLITKKNAGRGFEQLLESDLLKDRIISLDSSPRFRPMPFGIPAVTQRGRIAAVGDSACQIKTTTGGGILYGMKCAEVLAKILKNAYNGSNFRLNFLKNYDRSWKREIGTELKAGLALRKLLENVDDDWWNEIARVLEEPDMRKLVEEYGDFDRHYKFIYEFFRIPTARKFLLEMIRSNISAGDLLSRIFLGN